MKILYGEDLVNELRKNCDSIKKRLWIAVPFIGGLESVRRIIGRQWIENSNLSIRLLTDINEFNNFNSEIIKLFNKQGRIKHLAGLHAKIFIADNVCLITSANLTNMAFSKRHEIGIFLDGTSSSKTISIFESWWKKSEKVSLENLRTFVRKEFTSTEERAGAVLPSLWSLPKDPCEINYWLKPIGETENPITEDRLFNAVQDNLHFSTKEPKGVKVDDILIAYGVGVKRILSIYRVISEPIKIAEEKMDKDWMKRWPWYVSAKNITPNFGKNWAKHNLYANNIKENYLTKCPNGFITKVKGKTLGALCFGIDKINLDPDFAKFIIQQVANIDDKQ